MAAEPGNPVTCTTCGIVFFFNKEMEAIWRSTHKTFQCPNGHSLVWNAPTAKEKEKNKEIEVLKAKVEVLEIKIGKMEKGIT